MAVTLIGLSGQSYPSYAPYLYNGAWDDVPGNYAFAYLDAQGVWRISYIGQTGSFKLRMPPHEVWSEAASIYSASHVLARANPGGDAARLAEEKDLIAHYNPPLNVHHRTAQPRLSGLAGLYTVGRRGR